MAGHRAPAGHREGRCRCCAQYIRVLFAEITRIANHLLNVTTCAGLRRHHAGAVGLRAARASARNVRDDLGSHYHANYFRPGGVAKDIPAALPDKIERWMAQFPAFLDELEGLLTNNRIFKQRTVNIGVMTAEQAMEWGFSGPGLARLGRGVGSAQVAAL